MTKNTFIEDLKALNISLSPLQAGQFDQYAALLQQWNERINLTALTSENDIYEKHFYDCLAAYSQSAIADGSQLCDIGSGAGFPGLPYKIINPSLQVTLLEPTQKKCRFLQAVIDQLGLTGITVVNQRAEELAGSRRQCYDIVTARAVAPLNILLELSAPLTAIGGRFLALKGANAASELSSDEKVYQLLGLTLTSQMASQLSDGSRRWLLEFTKTAPTDRRYPRPFGQVKKNPLYQPLKENHV